MVDRIADRLSKVQKPIFYYQATSKADLEEIQENTKKLDDFAKAKYCFDKVLIKQPLPSVYFQRGYCSKKLGKMDDAVADFNKAIELDSSQYAALAHRAFIQISKKDYKKGKADAEASLAIFPDYAYGLLMLGQAKYFLKEQGFCDDFTKASESGLEEAVQAVKEYCTPK